MTEKQQSSVRDGTSSETDDAFLTDDDRLFHARDAADVSQTEPMYTCYAHSDLDA